MLEKIESEEIETYYYHIIEKNGKAPQQYYDDMNL
jgi:hypothetical protein